MADPESGRETARIVTVEEMQTLYRLRQSQLFCDAVLRTSDGSVFHVHRAIMSACSPYFLALFTTTLHSREQNDVTIPDVRSDILLLLIDYAYLRKIDISDANVYELLMTADYLGFLGVLELCCDQLCNNLNPTNCLGIMLVARRLCCNKLKQEARRYLLRYFAVVATQSEEFVNLSLDEVSSIIREDELNVKSEVPVWEAVLRWVNYDPENRKTHIGKLMRSIRMGLLETQYFLENVKDHPYVVGSRTSWPIIFETLKFNYELETNAQANDEDPEIGRPRVPHEVLFAIGGWSDGSPTASIETYDTRADQWKKVEEVDPAGPRARHGTAVLGYCIYVIGGFDGMDYFNSCRCFDAVTKVWREVAPMNARRCHVSVAVLGETIYAMGGYDGHLRQNTAERFNHVTNQWSLVAPMNCQRSDASACSLDNKVYITGGFNGQECMRSVEVYDPDTNQWTTLAPMRSRRSGVSCISYHSKVYVIGGFTGVSRLCSGEVYDPNTNTWTDISDMYNSRSNFAIEVIDDMIFAIGGFNGVTDVFQVERYDEEADEWYDATDMDIDRSDLSACVIKGLPNVYDYIHC